MEMGKGYFNSLTVNLNAAFAAIFALLLAFGIDIGDEWRNALLGAVPLFNIIIRVFKTKEPINKSKMLVKKEDRG